MPRLILGTPRVARPPYVFLQRLMNFKCWGFESKKASPNKFWAPGNFINTCHT